eukprot:14115882-Alexandrium_andersonii.AAC.1
MAAFASVTWNEIRHLRFSSAAKPKCDSTRSRMRPPSTTNYCTPLVDPSLGSTSRPSSACSCKTAAAAPEIGRHLHLRAP